MGIKDLIKEVIIDMAFSHLDILKSINYVKERKIGLWDLYELREKEREEEHHFGTVIAALDTHMDFDYKEEMIKKFIECGIARDKEEAKEIMRKEMAELTKRIETRLWVNYTTLVQWVVSPWGERDIFVPRAMEAKYTINYVVEIRKEDNKKLQKKIWRGFKKNMADELVEIERKIEERLPELLRYNGEEMKKKIEYIVMKDFWLKYLIDADGEMDKVIFRKYKDKVKDIVKIRREEVNMRFNEEFIKELTRVEKTTREEIERIENIDYWRRKYKEGSNKQQFEGGDKNESVSL